MRTRQVISQLSKTSALRSPMMAGVVWLCLLVVNTACSQHGGLEPQSGEGPFALSSVSDGPFDLSQEEGSATLSHVPRGTLFLDLTFAQRIDSVQNEFAALVVEVGFGGKEFATHWFDGSEQVRVDGIPFDLIVDLELTGLDGAGNPSYFAAVSTTIPSEDESTRVEVRLAPAYTFDRFNERVTVWPQEHLVSINAHRVWPVTIEVDEDATVLLTGIDDTSSCCDVTCCWIRLEWSYEYQEESAQQSVHDPGVYVGNRFAPPRNHSSRTIELRRYSVEPTLEELEEGVIGVLLIDQLHPLRIFYDFESRGLERVDFIPLTYRQPEYPYLPE